MSQPSDSPSLPLVRNCPPGGLRPLLAPGGRENYFSPDLQRMLLGPDEPLSRFLPPAKWQMPDRTDRSKNPQVSYTLPDEIIKTASPLTTLPKAEIDSFVAAVDTFMSKANLDAKGVPPFLRQCRAEFRLPNPEVDPSAYWVYGPEFDRRLLILWGCESPAGPSLTLEKVVEMIRGREMGWRDKQDLALKLARSDPKLGRFLAPRAADGSLMVGASSVPPRKLKRLERISPGEWTAFEEAAKGFYLRAHADMADVPPFERELRRDFRIPGPDTIPGDYYSVGSHFVVAVDKWPKEKTLPLTFDPALIPPDAAAAPPEPTVSAQLKTREQPPYLKFIRIGAIAAGIVVIAAVAWLFRPDRTKPTLAREDAAVARDATTVVLTFSEPIVIKAPAPAAPGAEAPPALTFFGSAASIKSATIDPSSKRKIIVVTEAPLRDGEKYGISVTGITDRAGNVIEPTSAEFSYFDARPPELKIDGITADGTNSKRVIFPFSKPISENSLNPSFFIVSDAAESGRRVSLSNVLFDPETKDHTAVVLESADEFIGNKWYKFELGNVTDASTHPNHVVDVPEPKRRFQYVDKLPPRIRDVVASGGESIIEVQFSKPIDKILGADLANYTVLDPAAAEMKLLPGGTQLNEAGDHLVLRLKSGKLSAGRYTLKVLKMADSKGHNPLTKPLERPFQFHDAVNLAPPKPKDKAESLKNPSQIDVDFDRGLLRDGSVQSARFRICDREKRPLFVTVDSVSQPEDNATRVIVKLKTPLPPGEYNIETNGLSDVFGTAQSAPAYAKFKVSGFTNASSSLIDWKQTPMLQGGTQLTLVFTERVTPKSANDLSNYHLLPAIKIAKVVKVTPGNEDNPATSVVLQLAQPCKESLSVSVSGLVLTVAPGDGPQTLSAVTATAAP